MHGQSQILIQAMAHFASQRVFPGQSCAQILCDVKSYCTHISFKSPSRKSWLASRHLADSHQCIVM